METKLLQLAINNLLDELEKLKTEVHTLREEVSNLKSNDKTETLFAPSSDELMDIKQVLQTLGICYNSLSKLIRQGLIKPVRINERRVRFTRKSILDYIHAAQ
jgi:predicted DNA-binding transcriptional regulator AlpA